MGSAPGPTAVLAAVGTPAGTTSEEAIAAAHATLVATFKTGRTKAYEWRRAQLLGLRRLCQENADQVLKAIREDLGRPELEIVISEVRSVLDEVDYVLRHLKSWMRPEAVGTPLLLRPARSKVIREPKGVVLQIAPWNFPLNLALIGLISALAAGNCCLLKPSEIAQSTEALLARLLPKYVDPEAVIVATGGVSTSTALLKLRWDHILYTGSAAVGKVVARAAAEHLTPVTLELGGKSPAVVLPGANVQQAARRILQGKFLNCGQVCIAPDYVLAHEQVEDELVREMLAILPQWYGEDASLSDAYGRIVSERHFERLRGLLETCGGEVLKQQGHMCRESKFIPPTLVRAPKLASPLMQEEVFGPILPILRVASAAQALERINAGEKPLALYVFGRRADADAVLRGTSSGGACVNDTLWHFANPALPFGGVGGSGFGRYHGKWGFDEFSHVRSIMYRRTWADPGLRYPPYRPGIVRAVRRLLVGPLLGRRSAVEDGGREDGRLAEGRGA